jgi:2-methylcitrate dehydratase PrpD
MCFRLTNTQAMEVSRLALVLAAAAHAAELDDTLPDSMVHAGAPVIAAALTVSMARDSSTELFFPAVAFGYEVAGRVGRSINAPPQMATHARGFHPTGVVGVLGAAAAAGALWGLEGVKLVSTLTLAASMGAGILEFLSGGGSSKTLHAGKAAADGVLAASLAAEGLTGPRHALEGRDGFLRAYGGEGIDGSPLTEPLDPHGAAIMRTRRKYHACCHHCQPSVEALSDLIQRRGFSADDVATIEAILPTMARYQVALPPQAKQRPAERLDAQLSLPYCLAARLVVGHLGPSAFEPPHLTDPVVLELASRVRTRTDQRVDASFAHGRMPAVVRVYLRNGDVIEGAAGFEDPPTDLARERDRLWAKWQMLLGPAMAPHELAELWNALQAEPVQAFRWALSQRQRSLHAR